MRCDVTIAAACLQERRGAGAVDGDAEWSCASGGGSLVR
jgi:hypothetical protein